MRKSSKRTTVAVLRDVIGCKTPEFAEIIGLSVSAVEKLEAGRLNLSEEVATRIAHETGVSPLWLLEGDVTDPPFTEISSIFAAMNSGEAVEFSREHFEYRRSHRDSLQSVEDLYSIPYQVARLASVMASASAANCGRLANYRIEKFLESLEASFGKDDDVFKDVLATLSRSSTFGTAEFPIHIPTASEYAQSRKELYKQGAISAAK